MYRRWIGITCLLLSLILTVVWIGSYWRGVGVEIPLSADESFQCELKYGRMIVGTSQGPFNTGQFQWGFIDLRYFEARVEYIAQFGHPMGEYFDRLRQFDWERISVNTGQGPMAWTTLTVPIWLFVLIAGAGLVWHVLAARRFKRRNAMIMCTHCGYDLRGTIAAGRDACPECGTGVSLEQAAQPRV